MFGSRVPEPLRILEGFQAQACHLNRRPRSPFSMPVVAKLEAVTKVYDLGEVKVEALRGVDLSFDEGDFCAIMGSSGSGKSTLLNILGCLDRPSSGAYFLGDQNVAELDDDALSEIRGQRLGFIFQSYNLIQQLTVVE